MLKVCIVGVELLGMMNELTTVMWILKQYDVLRIQKVGFVTLVPVIMALGSVLAGQLLPSTCECCEMDHAKRLYLIHEFDKV